MKPMHLLLVEDNEDHILISMEAFGNGKIANNISVVSHGKEAMDFLTRFGKYALAQLPDLLLTDVTLPKKNGHEVLMFCKPDTALKHIPVILCTTSSSDQHILKLYRNCAKFYITQPVEVNNFLKVAATIKNCWISVVKITAQINLHD